MHYYIRPTKMDQTNSSMAVSYGDELMTGQHPQQMNLQSNESIDNLSNFASSRIKPKGSQAAVNLSTQSNELMSNNLNISAEHRKTIRKTGVSGNLNNTQGKDNSFDFVRKGGLNDSVNNSSLNDPNQ